MTDHPWTCQVCGMLNSSYAPACGTCRALHPGPSPAAVAQPPEPAPVLRATRVLTTVALILGVGVGFAAQARQLDRWTGGAILEGAAQAQSHRRQELLAGAVALRAYADRLAADPTWDADGQGLRALLQSPGFVALPTDPLDPVRAELSRSAQELASLRARLSRAEGLSTDAELWSRLEARIDRAEEMLRASSA